MSFLDFLITYLAIASAFAMRVYFSNRHRPTLFVIRSVLFELVFWLPKSVVWSVRKLASRSTLKNVGSPRGEGDLWSAGHVDVLVRSVPSSTKRNLVRNTAERYSALRTAVLLSESERQPEGEFELFEISGHRNGRTGTSSLFRKNLAKLRQHSLRSAEDLIRAFAEVHPETSTAGTSSSVLEFFNAFDDMDAVAMAEMFETSQGRNAPLLPAANAGVSAESMI